MCSLDRPGGPFVPRAGPGKTAKVGRVREGFFPFGFRLVFAFCGQIWHATSWKGIPVRLTMTRYDARPDLLLVRIAARVLAAGPLHPARTHPGRGGPRPYRATGSRTDGAGAALPAHPPRAGHRGDEPPGAGAVLPVGPEGQAGL